MNTNKILIGGIAGGVVYFFLGYLVYGLLLADFMMTNSNQCMMKPMEEFTWWAMILNNLIMGIMYATIFSWSNVSGAASGAKTAAIIALMISLSNGLGWYSMSTMYPGLGALFIEVIVYVILSSIIGAVIAAVMGMGKKEG